MHFETYFLEQIHMHPSLQPRDVVKLCYQAAFGAEHLLSDREKAKKYLQEEYDVVAAADVPLYEPVSDDICRVNLAAWKYRHMPVEWLFRIFLSSAGEKVAGESRFRDYLQRAEAVLMQGKVRFSAADWKAYLESYETAGLSPVHHSEIYREQENPAYRIVNRKYTRLFPLLERAAEVLSRKEPCIIAIDGRAASGKTTMTAQLQEILEVDVIRMDDFFLPMELRTTERFAQPGGNVHHERFSEEVLPYISLANPFSYRVFDCSSMDYDGKKEIGTKKIRIVEGSYSCHPAFGDYADITVFSHVDEEEQMKRIRKRNGVRMAEMFHKRWIPLEESYFQAYKIVEKANISIGKPDIE